MQKEKSKEKEFNQLGFLGGDVSKGMCNFVLQDEDGNELESNFQLDDNRKGHQCLYELLVEFKKNYGLKKVIVGVESTGGYENNWYNGLRYKSKKIGLEVFRINPRQIYHETRTEGHRSITDGVSAGVIAGYLRKNYGSKNLCVNRLEKEEDKKDTFSSMRNMHKYIERLVGQNTRTKNAFEKLLYTNLPELLAMKGDKYPNWILELLLRYPSKEDILSADNEALIKIPYLTQAKANEIYLALENSIGGTTDEYTKLAISEQAADIQALQKKIKKLRKQLVKLGEKEEGLKDQIEIITSINGLAEDSAIGFLMEMERVDRFEKGKNLVAFWGMNPTIKQSGDKNYYTGMSKAGSSSARAIMFMAARNVIMYEPYFSNLYHEQRKKGKSHYAAIGVVMTKLTRIIYGMLKSKKKFDKQVDMENKKKVDHKNSEKNKNTKSKKETLKGERRYQDKESKAPVSMTQKVKRKQEQNVPS